MDLTVEIPAYWRDVLQIDDLGAYKGDLPVVANDGQVAYSLILHRAGMVQWYAKVDLSSDHQRYSAHVSVCRDGDVVYATVPEHELYTDLSFLNENHIEIWVHIRPKILSADVHRQRMLKESLGHISYGIDEMLKGNTSALVAFEKAEMCIKTAMKS